MFVSRLVWNTRNRPYQLLESVESFVPAVLKSDCAVCLCVYDDSDTPNAVVHIIEGLLKLRKKYGVQVRLVTKKNRLQFVERLKREGAKNNIPPEIIDFGLLTKRCFPHYYYLYPSYAIFHKRRDSHTFDRGDLIKLNNSFSFQFSLLLDTCLTTPLGKGLTCSLHEIGILLERFALQSDSDFTGCLRELFADYFTNYVDFLSSLKDQSSTEPQWWLEDVERYRQAVLAASRREDIIIPDEIKSLTGSFDGAVRFYKQLLSNYGKLCRQWEVIVEAAKECEMTGEV